MRRTTISLGIALTVLAACKPPTTGERKEQRSAPIVGGTESRIDDWAGVAYLEREGQHDCGAALVGADWVVTAAHCVEELTTPPDHVVVGRQSLRSTLGERIPIAKIVRHPNYDQETTDNDVALIQLARSSTRKISRIVVKTEWEAIEVGSPVTVVGWGDTSENGTGSDLLREVTVRMMSRAECAESYGEEVTPNMFCAGEAEGGKDACQGDSGGPIFAKVGGVPLQVGIVSWGRGCARPGQPGVYTRIVNYLDWLATESNGGVGKSNDVVVGSEDGGLADGGLADAGGSPDASTEPGAMRTTGRTTDESGENDTTSTEEEEEGAQPRIRRRSAIQRTTTTCQMLAGRAQGGTSTAVTMLALAAMLSLRGKRRRLNAADGVTTSKRC